MDCKLKHYVQVQDNVVVLQVIVFVMIPQSQWSKRGWTIDTPSPLSPTYMYIYTYKLCNKKDVMLSPSSGCLMSQDVLYCGVPFSQDVHITSH